MGKGIAVAVYAVLVATLATGVFDSFDSADDAREYAALALLVAANVAVGMAVREAWALALPLLPTLLLMAISGDDYIGFFFALVALPIGVALVAIGWGVGKALKGGATTAAAVTFVIAAVPAVAAALDTADRAATPHVPPDVQAALPTDGGTGLLCLDEPSKREHDTARREAEALIREIRRRPDEMVTVEVTLGEGATEKRDVRVRELGEDELRSLQVNGDCERGLQRRLQAALES